MQKSDNNGDSQGENRRRASPSYWKKAWRAALPLMMRSSSVRAFLQRRNRLIHQRTDPATIKKYLTHVAEPKLHLGCGPHRLAGWLNSDLHSFAESVIELDATKSLPLPDGVFAYVFTEHMVEHIPLTAVVSAFRECHRILQPGGILRVSTPDLRVLCSLVTSPLTQFAQEYVRWSCETYVKTHPQTAAVAVNNFVRNWGHTFVFDRETLGWALNEAGFSELEFCRIHESRHPALRHLENAGRLPPGFVEFESLIAEATKT